MVRWMTINDYPNYEVNNLGEVRNKKTNKTLKPGINTNGYEIVVLANKETRKTEKVHRLVAKTFYDVTDNTEIVNHIDGNKRNNNIRNLEWCTYSENNTHAYRTGLKKPVYSKNQPTARKVQILETGDIFNSIRDCADHISGNHRHISECLNGKLNSHKGYHFIAID